ncbi:M20/M25/M40 family metallo-hydrolase [Alicyclobacillus macrosporangiidus]|uniref:M20/M25/M40 family metallo-hydrolase n=1 Tax=Alicyclobacillus macrosporangiidus TaxID=392015 RepID=UPI00049597D7|nr:M20/M25/M40 family metallo-hydrolase [Alicyclobacillus macrosporangiidus]
MSADAVIDERALAEWLLDLLRLDSPPLREAAVWRRCAEFLRGLGFDVWDDGTGERIGGACGNLLAVRRGDPKRAAVLLSGHLDTVEGCAGAQPYVDAEGVVRNRLPRPLGADDKAGVAAILFGVAVAVRSGGSHGDVCVVLTVAEERGLLGARHLRREAIRAEVGLALDGDGPLGTVVTQGPALAHWKVSFRRRGEASDAPALRRAVMAAAARFTGAPSDEGPRVRATAFSQDAEDGPGGLVLCGEVSAATRGAAVRALMEAFGPLRAAARSFHFGWKASVSWLSHGFTLPDHHPALVRAEAALRAAGVRPRRVSADGASDADVLCHLGIPTVNIGIGCVDSHRPGEHIRLADVAAVAQAVSAFVQGVT